MDIEQLQKLATLSRLNITPEQSPALAEELDNVLSLVDQLQAAKTDGIEPMAHPLQIDQPLRSDTAAQPADRSALQNIAPATEAGLYLVPKVID
ncbi:MAG: Asp-tRNA(Asn)/Glu-tRNA(Gln) amidotransferase subunit GatC [Porticoccaceae bacterium]